MAEKGLVVVVSGPSGVGKGTLIDRITQRDDNIIYAVSATTREIRHNETEAVNYYYKTNEEFERLVCEKEILEWDEFCGHKYGTLRSVLQAGIDAGRDVILDLTIPGAVAIKEALPEDTVTIFILPPSIADLEDRIRSRHRETEAQLRERVAFAVKEELSKVALFDYVIVNDVLDEAVNDLAAVIKAERSKFIRNKHILNIKILKGEDIL